jgi:threonine dehydrogenase-like Zn-dependent dehydrogenase
MSKPAKKRAAKAAAAKVVASPTPPRAKTASTDSVKIDKKDTKQSRVIEMLRSSTGTTVDAVMKATGWQQHSVRGFFAGVVQKKLRLKLNSEKLDGNRVYRIVEPGSARSKTARLSNRPA